MSEIMADENDVVEPTIEAQAPEQAQQTDGQQAQSESPEQVSGEGQAEQATEAEAKEPPAWAVKRIGELTAKQRQAEREAQELRQRLAQMEVTRPLEETSRDGGNFETLVQQRVQAELAQREAAQRQQAFDARCNDIYGKGAAEFKDFDSALGTFAHIGGLPPALLEAVTDMPDAHRTLYALGRDPARAMELAALPPVKLGMELARLTAAKAPRPVSGAPAPITAITGGSAPAGADPEAMSDAEWHAQRQRQRRG